jgi:hypothetical protein
VIPGIRFNCQIIGLDGAYDFEAGESKAEGQSAASRK